MFPVGVEDNLEFKDHRKLLCEGTKLSDKRSLLITNEQGKWTGAYLLWKTQASMDALATVVQQKNRGVVKVVPEIP